MGEDMTYYTKLKTVQDHINFASEQIQADGTFAAKAHKKEAMGILNAAYSLILRGNVEFSLDNLSREDCWLIPFDLHQIREKHMRLFDASLHAEIKTLLALRSEFKEVEIVKPAPKNDRVEAKHKEVSKTVHQMIQDHVAKYHEAVELGRLFGGLPVSVTPHLVTNEFNTTFTRCFYYLNGKMTPLSVIMAAAEKLAAEKEKA